MYTKDYLMKKIVLIDSSSYSIYRVTATIKYWKKSNQSGIPDIENTEFLNLLGKHYIEGLTNFGKKIGICVSDMILVRDCKIEEIWRRSIYPKYKQTRLDKSESKIGPIIKWLNVTFNNLFLDTIRIQQCEADDIIYMYMQLCKDINKDSIIYIIGNDSDYEQINIDYDDIHIILPKKFKEVDIKNPEKKLEYKIKHGDKTDNILSSKNSNRKRKINKQLIDLTYIPRELQNYFIEHIMKKKIIKPELIPKNYLPRRIQLGLCCININLQEQNPKIFTSRKPILETIKKNGANYIIQTALQNCKDLEKMIHWNAQHGIRVFRISSELFPHIANKRINVEGYTLKFAKTYLKKIGRIARKYKQRLTFHPGQYNIIGAHDEEVFENTLNDLKYQANVLDLMECDQNSVLVIHGGGIYNDKNQTIKRWILNFKRLPKRVQRRLVLENCERNFSIVDCLHLSDILNIPVVFDTHHFFCYKKNHPNDFFGNPDAYIEAVVNTWKKRNITPKFHISEQGDGKLGHHSDFIQTIPEYLLEIPEKYGVNIDIMIEAKMKEKAIFYLYNKYPSIDPR